MERETRKWYEIRARVLKGMAHPTRLFIIHKLMDGEQSVGALTEMIGDDISTVSKHLSLLRGLDIIQAEKRGLHVYYHLSVGCLDNFCGCVEQILHVREGARVARRGGSRSL